MTKEKYPILRGYVIEGILRVHCPHCDVEHSHGIDVSEDKGTPTHRAAHCVNSSPFKKTGYMVAVWDEIKPKKNTLQKILVDKSKP